MRGALRAVIAFHAVGLRYGRVSRRSDPQAAESAPVPAQGLPSNEEVARDLATRATAGDLAATQEFLAYVWPTLTRVAAGVLGARHADLDDAVQQSMIALVRALPAFRGECHPAGYASRITLRVALRVRRNAKRDATRREALGQLGPSDEHAPSATSDGLGARRRELLRELLEDLPEEQAEALTLRVVMGWSLEEVARASGAPVNTVRSRVRLAKEALRARIRMQPALAELEVEA
jgi:RNA polymerase sigma factor (sigma-70 family)